jgi:hypothetical protein
MHQCLDVLQTRLRVRHVERGQIDLQRRAIEPLAVEYLEQGLLAHVGALGV